MSGAAELVTATASVKDGRLFLRNRRAFDQQVAQMPEKWTLEVTVKRLRATRSIQQNRWYWGCIIELLSEHTGYSPDEMHEVCKAMFIPKKVALQDGNGEIKEELVIGGSSRSLNTLQFGEYCEAIRRWAATELDVNIPDPTEWGI